jgi:hypothetical protein
MTCPTCDATMQGIGYGMFHCPRCGTLKGCPVDGAVVTPALVGRCREFQRSHGTNFDEYMGADWDRLGIPEAINPPATRRGS